MSVAKPILEYVKTIKTQAELSRSVGAFKRLLENRLAIIIAHGLSTIRLCDDIIVLDQGRIVEEGTHLGLMEKGGMYSAFFRMQFREEEGFEKTSVASKLRTH